MKENKKQINFIREFNNDRTNFLLSILFVSIESLIPGITIWILVGFDFGVTMNQNLPQPVIGFVALICFVYFLYTFLSTTIFYFCKFHKADNFTFSITITVAIITVILIGYKLPNKNVWILVKFIIVVVAIILSMSISVFTTLVFKNYELRRKENLEIMYKAWKNGDKIPTNKEIKLRRYETYIFKKNKRQEDLQKFKQELDYKINKQLEERENKKNQRIKNINDKLDEKENKKRNKKNSNFK